jgi:molybdopterin synthase catalytic subunit
VLPPASGDWIAVTVEVLPVEAATEWVTTESAGAVVVFLGVVRDNSEGRHDVRGITYEAYEEEAVPRLAQVAAEARRAGRWWNASPCSTVRATLLSEASVAVVVSSPHRPEAFEAARFCIDTLKETVPIWKREHWEDGSDWGRSSHPVRSVTLRSVK